MKNNRGEVTTATILLIWGIAVGLKVFTMGMQHAHDKEVEKRNEQQIEWRND